MVPLVPFSRHWPMDTTKHYQDHPNTGADQAPGSPIARAATTSEMIMAMWVMRKPKTMKSGFGSSFRGETGLWLDHGSRGGLTIVSIRREDPMEMGSKWIK